MISKEAAHRMISRIQQAMYASEEGQKSEVIAHLRRLAHYINAHICGDEELQLHT
jgi:hypothetical protein